jgi:hypothetical protein
MKAFVNDPTQNRFDVAGFVGYRHLEDLGNDQWRYEFENGYGGSVIRGPYTYGGEAGLFEVAVFHMPDDKLCYRTPVTNDVEGWLDDAGVLKTLEAIRALPRNDTCPHGGLWGIGK